MWRTGRRRRGAGSHGTFAGQGEQPDFYPRVARSHPHGEHKFQELTYILKGLFWLLMEIQQRGQEKKQEEQLGAVGVTWHLDSGAELERMRGSQC